MDKIQTEKAYEDEIDIIDGNDASQVSFEEWRGTMIETCDKVPYVQKIRGKMEQYGPMFEDMISADSDKQFSCDQVRVMANPKLAGNWGGQFSQTFLSISVDGSCLTRFLNMTLLHEMIHLHEFMLSDDERLECHKKMEEELSKKISGHSTIMERENEFMMQLCPAYTEMARMTHSDLFFLKSLDIDLRIPKYNLGPVGGYGFREAIGFMQSLHII